MFINTNGGLIDTPERLINHFASLPEYTDIQKSLIEDHCACCAKSFARGVGKVTKEEVWFGALDVFPYISNKHEFTNEDFLIKRWGIDWQKARLKERPDVDIDKSTKSQLGKIFYDALLRDKNAIYKWRRVEGKYFEYCRIK